ncbi:hypothetical protein MA5S1215_4973 [Mycobacteroides abscessus 5S-1215]|nr:hypothetical protein MA5S1215_4973 [Mycobacteroides abscessus 5S-1215]
MTGKSILAWHIELSEDRYVWQITCQGIGKGSKYRDIGVRQNQPAHIDPNAHRFGDQAAELR